MKKRVTGLGGVFFKSADRDFMFNYRVENLKELLQVLKEEAL